MFANPDFPGLPLPNPEEGISVFAEAIKTADAVRSSIIFANDPDADRFAIAERFNGRWKVFNGNELALLLGHYIQNNLGRLFPGASRLIVMTTPVSSRAFESIARDDPKFEFSLVNGTGFKHLAASGAKHATPEEQAIFAYEESIGYMIGTEVLDKDGISALVLAYSMAQHLSGQSFHEHLEKIYKRHGRWTQLNGYYTSDKMSTIRQAFELVREAGGADARGSGCTLQLAGTQVLIRTSGTEPKLKYYAECWMPQDYPPHLHWEHGQQRTRVRQALDDILAPLLDSLQHKYMS